ncbi:MAG: protein-(glutamine-N5) methyltransferase, release factor-specific [Deltaproteobacteria bacterium RIFOXYD12_FULL_50_9]|nr:MAG: protein-(glutamine-N5) methyltransferase, release factor-specific [Deltaproteobacteria bacterium RIFOXYD12_FULL_50_9]
MNIKKIYQQAVERLLAAGVADAAIDVGFLLSHLLKCSRAELFVADRYLSPGLVEQFGKFLARRMAREPVAYIIGEQEFWSLSFLVTPDVLIPRPETEHVVEAALELNKSGFVENGPMLDLGTGSGILAICLALEMPDRQVVAVDRSRPALLVAAANAKRHGVSSRVNFVNSCWLEAFRPGPIFSVVVTNPPYVAQTSMAALEPEVRVFEPALALDGGFHGVREIEIICRDLDQILKAGGWFFMEIGFDQEEYVLELFRKMSGYDNVRVIRDYAGLPRVLQARKTATVKKHG